MFEIFKSSIEYSKFGNALDKAFSDGQNLMLQIERSPNKAHSKALLIGHCKFIHEEITQRGDIYKWPVDRKIICLKIKVGRLTILEAVQAVYNQVLIMAEKLSCKDEILVFL